MLVPAAAVRHRFEAVAATRRRPIPAAAMAGGGTHQQRKRVESGARIVPSDSSSAEARDPLIQSPACPGVDRRADLREVKRQRQVRARRELSNGGQVRTPGLRTLTR